MSEFNKYFFDSAQYKSASNDLENFIFDHEKEFLAKFAGGYSIDLTKISVNSHNVNIVYILNSGQHISDSILLQDLMTWIAEVDYKENIEKLKDFNLETEDLVVFLQKVQNGELTCRLAAQILNEKIEQNRVNG